MKKIYIVLSDTGSLFTRTIKFVTKQPYNHTSIAFNKDLKPLYSFGRKNPNNPFIGGFVEESIDSGTFKKFKNTKCLVVSLDITAEHYNQLKTIVDNFRSNKDKYHYNLLGVLGVLIDKPINRENRYFCSSFVAEVMYQSELAYIDRPPQLTRPHDFLAIDDINIEYEGLLKEYRN